MDGLAVLVALLIIPQCFWSYFLLLSPSLLVVVKAEGVIILMSESATPPLPDRHQPLR